MIFWIHTNSSRVQYNDKFCHCINSYEGSGLVVDYQNFRRGLAMFVSRNRELIRTSWIIDSDLYLAPNKDGVQNDLLV
jgi:hypothetical protein